MFEPHPTYNRFNSLKILAYADRLRQIAKGEGPMPYPIDWHVYPSNLCNHRCVWCMFRQDMPDGGVGEQFRYRVVLREAQLMRAVEDAARTGAVLMHFSGGGEPLLNKHTLGAMKLAGQKGLAVALSTNGRLLTPEVAHHVDYLRVSLNAGTAQEHWRTNHAGDPDSRGDWELILQAIREAVPHKRGDIGLAFVVDHRNWRDIYPFCQLAAELGVDFVHIRPAFYYDAKEDEMVRACMPQAWALCEAAKSKFGDKVAIFSLRDKFEGYWTPRLYHRCLAVWTGVVLCATGDFAVCQDRTDLRFGAEWAEGGATFEAVWNSPSHWEVVEKIRQGAELDKCPRCVWNKRNEVIDRVFVRDEMRLKMV